MPKPTMLKLVRKAKEDRGTKAPVLLSALPGLLPLLRRLGSTSRGYALAGAGVVVGAVVVVSLLSWLAPDSDRPFASPLAAVGRVAGGVLEQVDDQVEALLGTDGETVLRSVREGLTAASSATPWPGNSAGIAASPSGSTASPDSASPSTDDAAAPTGGESSSDGAPSQPASSAPSSPSETPTGTDTPASPVTSEPPPPTSEEPPVAEEPSPPPAVEEPPPAAEEPPPVEEPAPPPIEEPPPVAEEPPSVPSDPPPAEEPPQTLPGG